MNRRHFFRSLACAGLAACARVWPTPEPPKPQRLAEPMFKREWFQYVSICTCAESPHRTWCDLMRGRLTKVPPLPSWLVDGGPIPAGVS